MSEYCKACVPSTDSLCDKHAMVDELIEVCEYFLEGVDQMGIDFDHAFAVEKIRVTLAKAEGK